MPGILSIPHTGRAAPKFIILTQPIRASYGIRTHDLRVTNAMLYQLS